MSFFLFLHCMPQLNISICTIVSLQKSPVVDVADNIIILSSTDLSSLKIAYLATSALRSYQAWVRKDLKEAYHISWLT